MTQQEFVKNMTYLGLAYNKEFTQEQVELWYGFFRNDDDRDFRKALSRIIVKNKFLPSIAEVKEEMSFVMNPQVQLTAEDEWNTVERAISKYGYYNCQEAEETFSPFTKKVVRNMGGFRNLCLSNDGDWVRKNFIKMYDEMKSDTKHIAIMTEPQLSIEEIKRKAELLEIPDVKMLTHDWDYEELEKRAQIIKNI